MALLCLTPWISAGGALLLGIMLALLGENPYANQAKKRVHTLLTFSVMGLGAGMNLNTVARVGLQGFGYTIAGIAFAFSAGMVLSRLLRTERDPSLLITVGTAICGGSAIAAVAPTIRAKQHDVSIALGTIFLLNALALVVFPWLGHRVGLDETQFGLWSALAIHDTSSVVGATLQYGAHALEVGTTVKLARALWIVPVTLAIGFLRSRDRQEHADRPKAKRPWFILGFLATAACVTYFPVLQPAGHGLEAVARRSLVLTLFLIGSNLSRATIRQVGIRPFALGISLWLVIGGAALAAVMTGWIH